jgi:urease accessory protein
VPNHDQTQGRETTKPENLETSRPRDRETDSNVRLIWQLIDSAFPTGSFAHSNGLEAAFQNGEVSDDRILESFVHDTLHQTGHTTLPLVTAAHNDPDRLIELDAIAHAYLTNAIANRASRAQGRTLAATCARVWSSREIAAIEATARTTHGHVAPLTGATFRALEVPLRVTQQIVLFTATRNVLAAAVRLGIVGPYRAQRLQHECGPEQDAVLERCCALAVDQLSHTAPVLDLLQSSHDRLYSRLFQS